MSYYIRILGTKDIDISLDEILQGLDKEGFDATLGIPVGETPEKWSYFELKNDKDKVLAIVERDAVKEGELGKDELDEFRESIMEFQPASGAKWLQQYFDQVQVIYAIQILDEAFNGDNYPVVTSTQSIIWNKVGGILQADEEGFSNEEGYHILWQFSDDVEGQWNCGVINESGEWEYFNMDLEDAGQVKEFKAGVVPAGARRIKLK